MPVKRVKTDIVRTDVQKTVKKVATPERRTGVRQANTLAQRKATLRRNLEAKTAAQERTTRRVNTAVKIKNIAARGEAAAQRRAAVLTQKVSARRAAVNEVKTRKLAEAAKQRAVEGTQLLTERAARVKSAREASVQLRRQAIRTSAQVVQKTREVRATSHAVQLGHANAGKTIVSDATSAGLNVRGASSNLAIAGGANPASGAARRELSQTAMKNGITSDQGNLANLTRDTANLKSMLDGEVLKNQGAKLGGATAEKAAIKSGQELDIVSGTADSLNAKLKPVPSDKVNGPQEIAARAQKARGDADGSDVARAKAEGNKNAATEKQRATEAAARIEAERANLAASRQADAAAAAEVLRKSKQAAENQPPAAPTTDPATARAATTDAEGNMVRSQDGVNKAGDDLSSSLQRRQAAEADVVRNASDLPAGEAAETRSRNDMNDGDAQYSQDANALDTLNNTKSKLETVRAKLLATMELLRIGASRLGTSPSKRTGELGRQDDLLDTIRTTKDDYDAAVKKLTDTLARRQRTQDLFSGRDQAKADNQKRLSDAEKANSDNTADKNDAIAKNNAYTANEAKFREKTNSQKRRIKKKANVQECLEGTNDVLVKTEPPLPERAPPNPDTAKAAIQRAAVQKELARGLQSREGAVRAKIQETEEQIAAAKAKVGEQDAAAARAKKNAANEQKKAAAAKARAEAEAQKAQDYEDDAEAIRDDIDENVTKLRKVRKHDRDPRRGFHNMVEETKRKFWAAENAKKRAKDAADGAETQRRTESEKLEALQRKKDEATARREALRREKAEQLKAKATRNADEATARRQGLEDGAKKPPSSDDYDAAQAKLRAAKGDEDANAAAIRAGEEDAQGALRALDDAEDMYDLANYSEADLVKERDTLQAKITELETKIRKASADAESSYPYSSDARNELLRKVEELKSELDAATQRKQEIEDHLGTRRAEKQRLETIVKQQDTLRKEAEDLDAELKRNDAEIDDIQRQIDENNAKPHPDRDLDVVLKVRQQALRRRNEEIRQRLLKIRQMLDDINGELEKARLRRANEDAMRKLRDAEERKKKLMEDSDAFDILLKRRTARLERVVAIFGISLGILMPAILAELRNRIYGLPPGGPAAGPAAAASAAAAAAAESGAQAGAESGAESGAAPGGTPGSVQTCYDEICTIQNLLCKKGSSEYLRGCKDGTLEGTTDGKHDGAKDEKRHRLTILPLERDELMKAVAADMATFSKIQKEAYCIEIENEAQAAHMTINELYTLYPDCKVSSKYGSYGPYGPKRTQPSGPFTEAQAGGAEQTSDYVLGRIEAYRDAYMRAYTNAWALSKLNANVKEPSRPVVREPPPKYGEPTSASGAQAQGARAPVRVTKEYRTSEAAKILARLAAMDAAKIDTSMFAALRSSLLATVAAAESADPIDESGAAGPSMSGGARRLKKLGLQIKKGAGKTIQLSDLIRQASAQ